ncbi:MAG TPA: hypothetical protein VGI39_14390 [Polyangiaceae bacterium]|jgi:hypothetical protein
MVESSSSLKRWQILLLMGVYASIVIVTSWRHELWRDEVRALLMAHRSTSLAELFDALHNDGHPPLWHLILRATSAVGGMNVLKPLAVSIAIAATYLFVAFSPFPRHQKVLFVFGALPLYEYAVMCRNYGLVMLLLFTLALVWQWRFTHPLRVAVVLALLANGTAHGFILTGVLLFMLLVEYLMTRPRPARLTAALPYAITLAAMAGAWIVLMPDRANTPTEGVYTHSFSGIAGAFAVALFAPLDFLRSVVGVVPEIALTVVFVVLVASLLDRLWLALGLSMAASLFTIFSQIVYGTQLRQGGLYLIFVLFVLWIRRESSPHGLPRLAARAQSACAPLTGPAVSLLLAVCIPRGLTDVDFDLWNPRSSSKALGELLRRRDELRRSVVVSVTPTMTEALPYYADNPIWVPRESRFYRLKTDFTANVPATLELDRVVDDADRLHADGTPVVVVLKDELSVEGPYTREASAFHQVFTYTPESRARFFSHARFLAKFDGAYSDENYAVYAWN